MTDQIIDKTETTETGAEVQVQSQETESKMFSQQQLDDIVAKRVAQTKAKYSYDPAEVESLRTFKESIEEEQLIKRQDFDKVLSKQKEKSTAEITKLRNELTAIKVDGALISAASKANAVAPDHVASLLKNFVKLDETGKAVVVDADGKERFTDDAEPFTINQLTEEFLASNQYFRSAGPVGTGAESNVTQQKSTEVDLSNMDMTNPEHRSLYKKMKAQGKL